MILMRHLALMTILTLASCSAPSNEEMWSNPWSNPTANVMRVLAKNGVKGCGEFYQKANTRSNGDYAVACSRMPDGTDRPAWVGYEVFIHSQEVLGPDLTAVYTQFGGPPRQLTKDDL
jgi:hypothetical protein